jgi:hypothetical protein
MASSSSSAPFDEDCFEYRNLSSPVWEVFLAYKAPQPKDKEHIGVCLYCIQEVCYKANTTIMWQHIKVCAKMPKSVKEDLQKRKQAPKRSVDRASPRSSFCSFLLLCLILPPSLSKATASTPVLALLAAAESTPTLTQSSLAIPQKMSSRQIALASQKLDEAMADCLLTPFLLSRQSFRDFVHSLQPSYPLPGRKAYTKRNKLRAQALSSQLAKALKKADSVSLTCDAWTAPNGSEYEAFTFHFLDSNWEPRSGLAAMHHADCEPTSALVCCCCRLSSVRPVRSVQIRILQRPCWVSSSPSRSNSLVPTRSSESSATVPPTANPCWIWPCRTVLRSRDSGVCVTGCS